MIVFVLLYNKKLGGIKTDNLQLELRKKIVKLALLQYGKGYEHGEMGLDTFDCAGLVWFLYFSLLDIDIFSTGFGMSTTTKIMTSNCGQLTVFEENSRKDLNLIREGDILFFHRQSLSDNEPMIDNYYPGHCGIFLGDKRFIHASKPKEKVIISSFDNNKYWLDVLVGSKDLISDKTLLLKAKKWTYLAKNRQLDINNMLYDNIVW